MNREQLFEKETLNRVAASGGFAKLSSEIHDFSTKQRERSNIEREQKEQGHKQKSQSSTKIIKSKGLLGDKPLESLKPKITKIIGSTKKSNTTKKVKKR